MIDFHQQHRLEGRQIWSGYVRRIFQTLEIESRPAAQEISESLAVFCQSQPHLPRHSLSLLMARSFCITGDPDAATRILKYDRAHSSHAGSWLEVLSAEYPFPELFPLFSARALRPLRLASAGSLWVLDFKNIHLTEADRHELILFQTIRVLAEQVSNVWKKSSGQGTLGITGLDRMLRRRQDVEPFLNHLRAVLERCAQKNGWSAVPSVLLLDL
jgi:hypothetical protein